MSGELQRSRTSGLESRDQAAFENVSLVAQECEIHSALKQTVLVLHTVESVCSALLQSTSYSVLCLSVCFRLSTLGG